jgi:hypothetical protein
MTVALLSDGPLAYSGRVGRCVTTPPPGRTRGRGCDMVDRTCSVDGCEGNAHAHGLCSGHDHRRRRYGDPLGQPSRPTVEERFWSKVKKTADCWVWTAATNDNGYGFFGMGGRSGRMHLAPRVAWLLTFGEIPAEAEVRHRCDNPPCVNPSHLVLGTHAENMADMTSRKRQAVGVRFPHAKLTDEAVVEMRQLRSIGMTQAALGKRFGVSPGIVSDVLRGKRWKHV